MANLNDKIELEQAILRLFAAIDAGDAQLVVAMFTPNGVWHRRDGERVGGAAIATEMRSRPQGRRIEHLVSNFIVMSSSEQQAEVTFRTLAFADEHPAEGRPSSLSLPVALDAYRARLVERRGTWLTEYLKADRRFASEL